MSFTSNIKWPELEVPDIVVDVPPIEIGSGGGSRGQSVALVNAIEPALQNNLADFETGFKSQSEALAFFDQQWQRVVSGCSQLGDRACITDRQAGGKFDWFSAYRDPISGRRTVPSPGSLPRTPTGGITTTPVGTTRNGGVNLGTVALIGIGALIVKKVFF